MKFISLSLNAIWYLLFFNLHTCNDPDDAEDECCTPSLAAIIARSGHRSTETTPTDRWWLKYLSIETTLDHLPAGVTLISTSTNPYSYANTPGVRPPHDLFCRYLADPDSPEYRLHPTRYLVQTRSPVPTTAPTQASKEPDLLDPVSTAQISTVPQPSPHSTASLATVTALLPFAPSGLRARRTKPPLTIKLD